jgi:Calx-beta domain/SprB repeat
MLSAVFVVGIYAHLGSSLIVNHISHVIMRILVFYPWLIFFCLSLNPLYLPAQGPYQSASSRIGVDIRKIRQVITPKSVDQPLDLQHLERGGVYVVFIPADPSIHHCRPVISPADAATSIVEQSSDGHRIRFVAGSETVSFNLHYPCSWQASNPLRHYISIAREPETNGAGKSLLRALGAAGELTVKGGFSPEYLVKDVFIGGKCYDVKNIVFSGRPGQIGTFSNGKTSINMAEGVIITSGHINLAPGPNTLTDATANYSSFTPDSDLTQMALTRGTIDNEIYDMAALEFDFTPTGNVATFEFVFASEEYCEYVNSLFNDVFGFFISGPGINGVFGNKAENIARVPVTNDFVAVNSINNALNPQYFINNAGPTDSCVVAGPVGGAVMEIQYDGYTVVMRASVNVQPCKTYRFKLKIADLSDDILDSAIFLKAGSFNAGAKADANFVVNGDPNLDRVFEGCGMVELCFDRVSTDINLPVDVDFSIGGSAAAGADYGAFPGTITLPAGVDKKYIPVGIFNDQLAENGDSIVITLKNTCSCSDPDETLTILDKPAFSAKPDTSFTCSAGVGLLSVTPFGGIPPYSYLWSTGQTAQAIAPNISGPTNFPVEVQDACGQKANVTARAEVNVPPTAELVSPAPQLCFAGEAQMTIRFTGAGPFAIEYSIDGVKQPLITGITANPYLLPVNRTGLYQVTRVSDRSGCFGTGQGVLTVAPSSLTLSGFSTNATCTGLNNGAINTTPDGGTGPYTFTWEGPQSIGNVEDAGGLKPGIYKIAVEDASGCRAVQQFEVKENAAINASIAAVQNASCGNPVGGAINLETSGGANVFTYKWNNGATTQDVQNLGAGTYTVTVTDQTGCTRVTEALVQGDFKKPAISVAIPDTLGCIKTTVLLQGTGSGAGANIGYAWTANPGNIVGGANSPNATADKPGLYTLVVTDPANGCTASLSREVIESKIAPAANAGGPRTLDCTFKQISLDASLSAKGPQFSYAWSAGSGGVIIAGGTSLTPVVSAAGIYTVLVRNNSNGCTATASVAVNQNTARPKAAIAFPPQLTCSVKSIDLNGSASTPSGITYLWSSTGGIFQSGRTGPTTTVGAAGQYNLVVTNPQNGCKDTAFVNINQDYTEPQAIVKADGALNCKTKELTLNGSESITQDNVTFVWTTSGGGNIVSGKNTLNPVIDAPGMYTLVMTNSVSSCSSSASVTVVKNIKPPNVVPGGTPGLLTCTIKTLTLGDKNIPPNPNYLYSWTTAGGGNIVNGSNTATPTVDRPGTYLLSVIDQTNQCSDTASISIRQNIAPPKAVVAPGGQFACNVATMTLNATGSSIGPNISYAWTSVSGTGIGAGANTLKPNITSAGTYTLKVVDAANGCTATAFTVVTANPNLPIVSIAQPDTLTCGKASIVLNGTGSSAGFKYNWTTVGGTLLGPVNGPTATASAPGRYTLLVTNTSANCSASATTEVKTNKILPAASAGPDRVLDCTKPLIELDGSASSQGPRYAYSWTPQGNGNIVSGAGQSRAQVNATGIYQLVVTDLNNNCTSTDLVRVVPDPANPQALIKTPDSITCKASTISLDGGLSSVGAGYAYAWSGPAIASGADMPVATVSKPGTYTLVVTNTTNGCTASANIEVRQNISFPVADAGPDLNLNCYTPERKVKLPFNANTKDFSYTWEGPGVVSGGNTPEPILGKGGIYVLRITTKNTGCAAVDTIVVRADFEKPKANAGPAFQLTCAQNTYTLQAVADQGENILYRWETNRGSFLSPQNILNPTVNGAGEYYLTVTNSTNGCRTIAQVQISQAVDLPLVSIASPKLLTCKDTTITLNASASSKGSRFTYNWYPDPVGRIVSGANTLNPVIDSQGVYTLEIRDTVNGCVAFSSIWVEKNTDKPTVDAGVATRLTCLRTDITLKGIVGTNSKFGYRWEADDGGRIVSGANTMTPVVDQTGLYRLIVTDEQSGCVQTDSVLVLADRAVPVVAVSDSLMLDCKTPQGVISVAATGQGALSFLWSTVNGGISGPANDSELSVSKPGIYTVVVTENKNGCTAAAVSRVFQNVTPPKVKAGAAQRLNCSLQAVELNGVSEGNPDNFLFQWSTDTGNILAGENTLTPTVTKGGVYTVVAIDITNGCTATDRVDVSEDKTMPFATVSAPDVLTCKKMQVFLTGIGSQIGTNISYAWKTDSGSIVSGQNTIRIVVDAPGVYVFTVLNSANGCASEVSAEVSANRVKPVADAGPPQTLTCDMEELTLQGKAPNDPGIELNWKTTNGLILDGKNTLTPRVGRPGLYNFFVFNRITGCANQDDVWVQEEPNVPQDFEILLTYPTCKDNDGVVAIGKITGGIGPYLYSFDGGKTFSPEPTLKNISPGKYQLRIQDLNGCEFEKNVVVPPAPNPGVSLPPNFNIVLGDSLRLRAVLPPAYPLSLIDTVIWTRTPLTYLTFKSNSIEDLLAPYVKPFERTVYTVTVKSKDGCEASAQVVIDVNKDRRIYIPNVFDPDAKNGDNGFVTVFAREGQVKTIRSFRIFSRWGEMVFEAFDFQPNQPVLGWNGYYRKGETLVPAVFAYITLVEFVDGTFEYFCGDVTLVR